MERAKRRPLLERALLMLMLAGVVFVAQSAHAVPITFAFEGTITHVIDKADYIDESVVVGGHFSGQYTFESTMVGSFPDPYNQYRLAYESPSDPSLLMSAQFGNYTLTAPFGGVSVENGGSRDWYAAGTNSFDFLALPTGMVVSLTDPSAAMLDSLQLPLAPPPLSSLPPYLREFSLVADDPYGATEFAVAGSVESLIIIPEPATAVIALLLSSVGLLRRPQSRSF